MTKLSSLLLLRRRRRDSSESRGGDMDGLMDTLSNVVGVMALITSLTGVFAASSAINIQAPMQKQTKQRFTLLQASKDGIWNLQPAVNKMVEYDQARIVALKKCLALQAIEQQQCKQLLDGWSKADQVESIQLSVSNANGLIRRNGAPSVASGNQVALDNYLDRVMREQADQNQAVFVVLEPDGYPLYRAIKRKANQYKVPIGWEPWYAGDPIYFWGNAGRLLTLQ